MVCFAPIPSPLSPPSAARHREFCPPPLVRCHHCAMASLALFLSRCVHLPFSPRLSAPTRQDQRDRRRLAPAASGPCQRRRRAREPHLGFRRVCTLRQPWPAATLNPFPSQLCCDRVSSDDPPREKPPLEALRLMNPAPPTHSSLLVQDPIVDEGASLLEGCSPRRRNSEDMTGYPYVDLTGSIMESQQRSVDLVFDAVTLIPSRSIGPFRHSTGIDWVSAKPQFQAAELPARRAPVASRRVALQHRRSAAHSSAYPSSRPAAPRRSSSVAKPRSSMLKGQGRKCACCQCVTSVCSLVL